MPNKYVNAPEEVYTQAKQVISNHYKDLAAVGARIDILMAYAPENEAGEKTGPAVKLHGYPCNGVVSVVNLKNRVMGRSDAEIILDGDRWPDLDAEQQIALLDHEIRHITVSRDVEGAVINDTHGRPKLKMALHHYQFGWFTDVAKRNGAASQECTQARLLFDEAGESFFPFVKAITGAKVPKKKALKAPKK